MQEEVTNKTVTLSIRTTKLTYDVFKNVVKMYLQARKRDPPTGKITMDELAKQNGGMTDIEITKDNIKGFERYARKYKVNYALKKDNSKDPPVYLVFFKGRDQDAIDAAFHEFSRKEIQKANKVSIHKKLSIHRAAVKQQKRDTVKHKHQQQER